MDRRVKKNSWQIIHSEYIHGFPSIYSARARPEYLTQSLKCVVWCVRGDGRFLGRQASRVGDRIVRPVKGIWGGIRENSERTSARRSRNSREFRYQRRSRLANPCVRHHRE